MRKNGMEESSPAAEEGRPTARMERNAKARGNTGHLAVSAANGADKGAPGEAPARPLPQSYRELGLGIFAKHHPVDVGSEVLEKSDDRGAATRLRALETYAAWVFGKHGADAVRQPPRIIWDIPGPPYEPPCELPDPQLEEEGGEQ